MNKEITYADRNNSELIENLKKICIENFNGVMHACTYVWATNYYLPNAIKYYKKAGFDCALGLAMMTYVINQGLGITPYGSNLPNKLAGINGQLEKCKLVAESWKTSNKNWQKCKNMWNTLVINKDINLTGSYNWAQWGHSRTTFLIICRIII